MNKEKYIKKIQELERKSRIQSIKNHLPECTFDVQINSLDDFFEHFDAQFPEKRALNQDLETYLETKVGVLEYIPNLKIKIHCPKTFELSDETIKIACVNHFENRSIMQFHQNHLLLRKWLTGLIIGTFFLGICLLAANILRLPQFEVYRFCKVLSESFSIIGWVAIWEPACYLLYSRKDDKRKLRNCYILHSAEYFVERI
ncbi:MAG: hypothetical protein MJ188_00865 [Treponema sp.]|nr:hypothetical protein [Treponema sp.]